MSGKTKAPEARRAVAHIRCSTDRQDLSPDAQREAIAAWARSASVRVVATHKDLGVSGGAELERRPGLLAGLETLRQEGVGCLVVAKRDRLARDVLTAALVERLCEREGASIVSADGAGNGAGPEAQLLRGIMDLFAQYERALIRTRTRAALAAKKARGERIGGVPYGFRTGPDGKLQEAPEERKAVAMARRLRTEGRSLRQVGAALVEAGHRPRRGHKWHVQVLARLTGGPAEQNGGHGREDHP